MTWTELLVDPWTARDKDGEGRRELRGAALLLLGEAREYQEYAQANALPRIGEWPSDQIGGPRRFLSALVLQLMGQPGAVGVYMQLRAEKDLDSDLKVAASILAAVALDEADRPDAALSTITGLEMPSNGALARSLVAVHQSVYLAELDRFSEARDRLAETRENATDSALLETVRYIATLNDVMLKSLEGIWESTSVDPRYRYPLLARIDAPVFDSLMSYLDAQFKGSFDDPFSQSWVFQSEDPVESSLQNALFRVRCLADFAATRRFRSLIAKYRLISALGGTDIAIAPDLALLIRAGQADPAGRAANTFRRVGPLPSLRVAGEYACSRPWHDVSLQPSLAVISATSSLLRREDVSRCFRRVVDEFDDLVGRRHAGALVSRETLQAIAALLEFASATDHRIASRLLRRAELYGPVVIEDIPRAVRTLAWSSLGSHEIDAWFRFAERHLAPSDPLARIASEALRGIAKVRREATTALLNREYDRAPSPLLVATMIDLELPISSQIAKETIREAIQAIARTRSEIAAGTMTLGGGLNWPLLLARVLLIHEDAAGWRAIGRHIADPVADMHERATLLDFLAANRDQVPQKRRSQFKKRVPAPSLVFPLMGMPEELQGSTLRYLAAFSFVASEEALNQLLSLVASPSREARMQAARTLPNLVDLVRVDVLVALGLSLAQDADNNVRAWAARFLPEMLEHLPDGREAILATRLERLLSEPGEYVPLAALAGLDHVPPGSAIPRTIRRTIGRLRRHPSARIRIAVRSLENKHFRAV
jgi:hypothetical protein